ncbi:phage portal protein [Derxia gummosa]|uniref:Phage portal protein n=1 Tax=Derxia gummosa DSM 723 TaxID=1121388 RepID=A0A9U5CGY2_9BURK|nr:phage portal protein [Derxia gummosa]
MTRTTTSAGGWLSRAMGALRPPPPPPPAPARNEPALAPQALGENSVTTNLNVEELAAMLGAVNTAQAGVNVTETAAMRVSAVYGCVALIAGAAASLPFEIYRRAGAVRERAEDKGSPHAYWWLLNEEANDVMSSFSAMEYLVSAKLFHGDGFAELLRPSQYSPRVIGWLPHHPLSVTPFFVDSTQRRVAYRVGEAGRVRVVQPEDMIHVPSLGFDGLTSPSPITYAAREAIGTAIAGEAYNARFFNGGATFDYALATEGRLNDAQLAQLRASLAAKLTGGANSRVPLILTGGLKPAQLSVNPKDAEVLATRLFTVEEICRILGVPPHMVGHTDKTTSWGSGIEQQGIGFIRYTMQRHLRAIEQEFNRKVWPSRERYFVEFDRSALERGDLKSRYEAYRIALGRAGEPGWLKVNEVRREDKLPPIEGGDTINNGAPNAQPTPPPAG